MSTTDCTGNRQVSTDLQVPGKIQDSGEVTKFHAKCYEQANGQRIYM